MGSACLDLLDLIPNCVISYDNCVYVFCDKMIIKPWRKYVFDL